ncbi:MAG: heavy metal-binding protein [Gammaproteobacteria bacterium]|nr:heavy metal-binding protein [Gammaproteobacteria bacterium]
MSNSMSKTIVLKITGMSCKHCVMNATKAIEAVAGVENVDVSLEPGGAVVVGRAEVEPLIEAVTNAGYEAELN